MAYEQRPNTGTIFKNEKKAENHPDYKGQLNIDGKLMDIALWVKQGAKGSFFSASISEPRPRTEGTKETVVSKNNINNIANSLADDGLPF